MTLEQFNEFAKTLPENVDKNKVAKALNIELPVVVKPLAEQIAAISIVKHTPKPTKKNPAPQETTYIAVPSIKLSASAGCRGFWVNTAVAKQVALAILDTCTKNNI